MLTTALETTRSRLWPLLAGLALLLILLLALAPTERTLGQTVKLVYLHGALVRTAVILFAIGLPVNLVALLKPQAKWLSWGKAFIWAATVTWIVHTLFSMVTTYAAWGLFIAWYEPRTRFTFILAAVGLIIVGVTHLIGEDRFTSMVFALLAGLVLVLLPRLGFIQHPLDPIGTSPSTEIQIFYGAIVLVTLSIGGLVTVWLQTRLTA